MSKAHSYTVFPLGDAALLIDFGNLVEEAVNREVLRIFQVLQQEGCPYILDLIPAYSSLAVCYDVPAILQKDSRQTAFETMADLIETTMGKHLALPPEVPRKMAVPVCYAPVFAPDLEYLAATLAMTAEEIIGVHLSRTYRVFMIGFLPGFAYMGSVDPRIAIPRKKLPVSVTRGSVGIAGEQTGIYPLDTPGGWQIIGRCPLPVFDKDHNPPVLFRAGDEVTFYPISENEFAHYQTRHT
ncbi:MAG: 5-oxoprolinase subunit PxpB [Flavisolibacter sp.]